MRWLWRILGAVVTVVVIGVGFVALIPTQRIAEMASARFQALTGRALMIEGDVSPTFWPVLGVKTGPVTVANADWSAVDAPMLRAEGLTIAINAGALMGGEIRILGLEAERPQLVLERARDGRENWVFGGGGDAGEISTETPGVGRSYTLEEGLIRGGSLRFVDHGAGQDITVDDLDLSLKIPDFTGPFTVTASGIIGGQRADVAVGGGSYATFTEGQLVPLTLAATAGAARVDFNGRAGWNPMAAEGRLEADLSDTPALAALLGSAAGRPPEGFGARKLTVAGDLVLDAGGTAALRAATLTADDNVLRGDLDLSPGADRPKLTAQLAGDALSFTGVSGGEGGGASGGMQATGWPKDQIDVSALGAMDAEVALVANAVDLGAVKFGTTRLMLTIERARAVFDIRQLAAYGGAVTGEFVVNGRGGLSVGGNLSLANLQMQPLLRDLSGWDRLIAAGNLNLRFLGVGNSVDAIMQGLEGAGSLTLGKGELVGLDIGGMLRRLDTSFVGEGQKTIFDGVAGRFTIAGGQLTTEDLRLLAPYLTAAGGGRVGLGPRDLDIRIRPTAFPGQDGTGGVMVPLRITGPWADPTYRLDLESIAREKMEAEAAAAEARAKSALEEKLREELGVTPDSGETLEDAAKRRAQELLGPEGGLLLEGLLGGN